MDIKDCYWPWFEAFIHVNGDVKPCCYATAPVGNLHEDGDLEAIWTGAEMQELRQFVNENRLHPVCVGASCVYVKDRLGEDTAGLPPDNLIRMKRMAESGSGYAALHYGLTLLVERKLEEAEPFLRTAVARRSARARFWLASLLLERVDPAVVGEAIELLTAEAEFLDGDAAALLGRVYGEPAYGAVDPELAKKHLYDAISLGSPAGMFSAALLHKTGFWGEPNHDEYLRLLKLAASRGFPEADAELSRAAA